MTKSKFNALGVVAESHKPACKHNAKGVFSCNHCGKALIGGQRKWCSRRCNWMSRWTYPIPSKCRICGSPIMSQGSRHVYCSPKCQGRARRQGMTGDQRNRERAASRRRAKSRVVTCCLCGNRPIIPHNHACSACEGKYKSIRAAMRRARVHARRRMFFRRCELCNVLYLPRSRRSTICIACIPERLKVQNYRNSRRGLAWRDAVRKRDRYRCRICGSMCRPEVHHIRSFIKHPKFRHKIENGITLCHACHTEIRNYETHYEHIFMRMVETRAPHYNLNFKTWRRKVAMVSSHAERIATNLGWRKNVLAMEISKNLPRAPRLVM